MNLDVLDGISQQLESPFRENIQYYCLECIFNPQKLYLKPYCEYYLQQRLKFNDDAFQVYRHDQQFYLIDQNYNLIFYPFIESFCENVESSCDKYTAIHLNQTFFINTHYNLQYFYKENFLIINLILFCFNARQISQQCHDCINNNQILEGEFEKCKNIFYSYQIICNQQPNDFYNLTSQSICGSFCLQCYEGLCLQCVDDYFLQAGGAKCLKNNITHCKLAVQVITKEGSPETGVSVEQEYTMVLCERCEDNYIFVISIRKCLKMSDNKCLFAIASSILLQEQDLFNENFAYLDNISVYTTKQWCLEPNEQKIQRKLYFLGCKTITFFILCLQLNDEIWVCLKCHSSLGFAFCKVDKQYQIQKCISWAYLVDFHSVYRSAAFQNYNNGYSVEEYFLAGFNALREKNYQIIKQQSCHQTCSECTENGLCLRCKQNSEGRQQSLSSFNTECIECSHNCSLCYPRTQQQILELNTFFNNVNLTKYTVQCLKLQKYNDYNPQFFYDKLLRRFIQCQIGKPCKKQLNITLNLFCSQEDYEFQLASLDSVQKHQFILKNILFEKLAKNEFSLFYTNEFYEIANQKSITIITIAISGEHAQTCRSNDQVVISNKFSENIFSALCEVNLDFRFEFEMIFEIPNGLIIENFSSIFIQNIKLIADQPSFSIFFSGVLIIQKISLYKISVIGEIYNNNTLFTFVNYKEIAIRQFKLSSSKFKDSSIFNLYPQVKTQFLVKFRFLIFPSKIHYSLGFNKHINIIQPFKQF